MRCQEVEALFAPYVDDEAAPPERAAVDAHLHGCPPCRERVAGERVARDVVRARRATLRPCASQALRTRCAAHGLAPAIRGGLITARAWVPLSLAAAVILAVSSVLFLAGNSAEVLAAQLAVDHVKCFKFPPAQASVDSVAEGRKWEAGYGWPLTVPASAPAEQLELVAVRRCLSSQGRVAHMLYRWRGQPLSVFVLNSRVRGRREREDGRDIRADMQETVEKMGERAIIWSHGDRTYAVVGRDAAPELQQVARYVRRVSE